MELSAAEKRGIEMMTISLDQQPQLAVKFMEHLSNEVGLCAETLLTALIVYAQCVENLECTNELYIPIDKHIQWFKDND